MFQENALRHQQLWKTWIFKNFEELNKTYEELLIINVNLLRIFF